MPASTLFFTASITGNVADQKMLDANSTLVPTPAANGTLTDVEIDLGTATSVDVTIEDDTQAVFVVTGVSADTKYKIDDAAIKVNSCNGQLKVTTANISNAAHTLTVRAKVKR